MRLLFVADGRSPIALNWIGYFLERGYDVHLASTFPCAGDDRFGSLNFVPVAFSGFKNSGTGSTGKPKAPQGLLGSSAVRARTLIRQWLGPLTLTTASQTLQAVINEVKPDLIHAMRIPYEGMIAALADPSAPLLVSVWGNDFTLHARTTPLMARYTRIAMQRAGALHADCHRDARLARSWGFPEHQPTVVLPGAGGVQPELFYAPDFILDPNDKKETRAEGSMRELTVINPRGFRAYMRNDTFFRAIPLILASQPVAQFLCPTMAGDARAQRWLDELGVGDNVELLPYQTRSQMAALFRRSRVVISPSTHDGTPNTLLEAMACGCLPVAGDIESLREWISPGVNGLLVDPTDPQDLARAVLEALGGDDLHRRALSFNLKLIQERASYWKVMEQAESFYRQLV